MEIKRHPAEDKETREGDCNRAGERLRYEKSLATRHRREHTLTVLRYSWWDLTGAPPGQGQVDGVGALRQQECVGQQSEPLYLYALTVITVRDAADF